VHWDCTWPGRRDGRGTVLQAESDLRYGIEILLDLVHLWWLFDGYDPFRW